MAHLPHEPDQLLTPFIGCDEENDLFCACHQIHQILKLFAMVRKNVSNITATLKAFQARNSPEPCSNQAQTGAAAHTYGWLAASWHGPLPALPAGLSHPALRHCGSDEKIAAILILVKSPGVPARY